MLQNTIYKHKRCCTSAKSPFTSVVGTTLIKRPPYKQNGCYRSAFLINYLFVPLPFSLPHLPFPLSPSSPSLSPFPYLALPLSFAFPSLAPSFCLPFPQTKREDSHVIHKIPHPKPREIQSDAIPLAVVLQLTTTVVYTSVYNEVVG